MRPSKGVSNGNHTNRHPSPKIFSIEDASGCRAVTPMIPAFTQGMGFSTGVKPSAKRLVRRDRRNKARHGRLAPRTTQEGGVNPGVNPAPTKASGLVVDVGFGFELCKHRLEEGLVGVGGAGNGQL